MPGPRPERGRVRGRSSRLEWLTELPWGELTQDNLDLGALQAGLDQGLHFGLDDVKKRIVEFCAVRRPEGRPRRAASSRWSARRALARPRSASRSRAT